MSSPRAAITSLGFVTPVQPGPSPGPASAATATPATLALPAIWKDWDTFYRLAAAASKAAETMADTPAGKQQLRAEGLALRASCDACHSLFLRPYHESKVTDADINFDFDAVFKSPKTN